MTSLNFGDYSFEMHEDGCYDIATSATRLTGIHAEARINDSVFRLPLACKSASGSSAVFETERPEGRFTMAVVDGVAHWGIAADTVLETPMDADSLGVGVMALKRRLQALGCFEGEVTPVYDEATAEAIKAFQTAAGLPADGIASLETQRALFDGESFSEG